MDQHVHHLQYSYAGTPWTAEDPTSLAGAVTPALASSLTSFEDLTRDERHVLYVGVDQHMHQLFRSGAAAWSREDVTLDSGSTLPTVATPLSSFKDDSNNQQHAFYFGLDTHLYHLYFNGRWNTQDLTPANPVPTL